MPTLQDGGDFYELNSYGELVALIWQSPYRVQFTDSAGARRARAAFIAWCETHDLPRPRFESIH